LHQNQAGYKLWSSILKKSLDQYIHTKKWTAIWFRIWQVPVICIVGIAVPRIQDFE
jgi:hypothetical protein